MRILIVLLLFSTGLRAQLVGDTENGLASYYSREYDGAETAYNLIYDRNDLVAAHKTFPPNSTVEVKNLDNGKTVRVRVIDKGPFIRGRVIEVSERAAELLGMIGRVTVPVEVTLISTKNEQAAASRTVSARPPTPRVADVVTASPTNVPAPTPAQQSDPRSIPDVFPDVPTSRQSTGPAAGQPAAAAEVTISTPPVKRKVAPVKAANQPRKVTREPSLPAGKARGDLASEFKPGVYKVELTTKPAGNFAVQVGSYRDLEGAMEKLVSLQARWFDDILVERVARGGSPMYKVLLGPFDSMASAKRYAGDLKKRYAIEGFPVAFD